MINEEKLINLLFEGNENLVVQNGERFHLEDYIEYFNKPGLIVATIKGVSDCGIQQLPVGAVDSFRFMQITNEDAIINQNKNNGKSYDQILKEYEGEKGGIIDQWKKMNGDKFNGLRSKYGERFLGMDIVENKKKIEHKEEVKKDDDKNDKKDEPKEQTEVKIMEDEMLEEGIWQNFKDKLYSINKTIANNLRNSLRDTRTGLANAINSPFAQKSVKLFSKVVNNLDDDIDESTIKMYWEFDNKKIPMSGALVLNIKSRQYLTVFYQEESTTPITLKDIGDELDSKIKNGLTRDISGIIGFMAPMNEFEQPVEEESPKEDTDVEKTVAESKNREDVNLTTLKTFRPVKNIVSDKNSITVIFDKSASEKKKDKRRKNIWK